MKTDEEKKLDGTLRRDRQKSEDLEFLEKIKRPPKDQWDTLSDQQKKLYNHFGKILVKTKKLTELDLPNIMVLATAWDQWIWAQKEINRRNGEEMGSGYLQKFKNDVRQVSPEITVSEKALKTILDYSKMFGLSFKDRYAMSGYFGSNDDGQLDMFAAFDKQHQKLQAV